MRVVVGRGGASVAGDFVKHVVPGVEERFAGGPPRGVAVQAPQHAAAQPAQHAQRLVALRCAHALPAQRRAARDLIPHLHRRLSLSLSLSLNNILKIILRDINPQMQFRN